MAPQPSENPRFKLTYFNLMGKGECLRMLFAYGGIEYEDNRIEREDWPALKPSAPLGQMPFLDVDGIRVHQSNAMNRYVARRVGLAGSNDWESLLIDIVVDTICDFSLKGAALFGETDEDVKAAKLQKLKSETVPFYLEKLDAMAGENDGYFALGQLTWADVFFVAFLPALKFFFASDDLIDDYANLQTLVNNVNSVDSIKAWIESRPETPF